MDLDLTSDQELFRDTTRQFLQDQCPLVRVRELAGTPDGFERNWWQMGAHLGWTSMLVGEEHGGGCISGRGLEDLALVAEEMGALVSPGPLVPVNTVAQAVSAYGRAELQAAVLPGLLSGESIAAWALSEPGRSVDELPQLTARGDGDSYVLDGVKSPVEAGGCGDWLLVAARLEDEPAQFVLPASLPGVEVSPLQGLDLVRRHAKISFDGVRVGAEGRLEGDASTAIEHQLCTTWVLQCAESVGATQRVFDFTVEYAFDRHAFGRPIASYQALKHRFADMKLWLESSLAITVEATKAVQAGTADAVELARIAKAYVGERCPEIIQECVQMHGGIGVTWDHDIHLYLRRVVLHRQTFGDPMEQRDRVGALVAG